MKFRFTLLVIIIALSIFSCSVQDRNSNPVVENGVINLSNFSLTDSEGLKLDGNWIFYRNELLTPEDFNNGYLPESELIQIPGNWTSGGKYEAWGYGSFRMEIHGLIPEKNYSLYIPDMLSSFRLWVDGDELATNGQVAKASENSSPQFLPITVSFKPKNRNVEIICQISNFNYRKSGIWRSLKIGRDNDMIHFRERRMILESLLAGVLLAIAFYHLTIFSYKRKEKAELLFGSICLTLFIRIVVTSEQLLTFIFPSFPWELARRLEFIPFYLTAPLIILFLTTMFPKEFTKKYNRIYFAFCFIQGAFFLLFPIRISNNLILATQAHIIIVQIYIFIKLITAIKRKRINSISIFIAYTVFTIAIFNDMLHSNMLIESIYLIPVGFLIFIFIQSSILTKRFTKSFMLRKSLAKSRDKFLHASQTDSLTGLYNVRYLHNIAEKEILRAEESNLPLSLIMADVDNFKSYNDKWGHKSGDKILQKIAEIIRTSARENDSSCRYGGEEFSLILPETDILEAAEVADRIRMRFESASYMDNRLKGTTVSLGVALYKTGDNVDELIERADKALYHAKHNGKNRVELSREPVLNGK